MQLLICLHTGFEHFELHIERILGTSSSGNENLDVKFYIGTVGNIKFGYCITTPYTVDNINLGNGTHRNVNGTDNMELFTTNDCKQVVSGLISCVNFGARQDAMHIDGVTGCNNG